MNINDFIKKEFSDKDLPLYYDENLQENVYECHYTRTIVKESEVIWVGAIIPNVKYKYACTAGYEPFRKESVKLFNESEQNCNTCKNLIRIKHKKSNSGLLYGKCSKHDITETNHPYQHLLDDGIFSFSPNDYMGMNCYESRYNE